MATEQPNVLLVLADDIGWFDVGAYHYAGEKLWTVLPAAAIVQQHAATFMDFPPRQAPPDFNPQAMVQAVLQAAAQRQGN